MTTAHSSKCDHPSHAPLFEKPIECVICSEAASALFCFPKCGHFVCYVCGLRMRRLNQSCPVCRQTSEKGIITTRVSIEEDQFSEEEVNLIKKDAFFDRRLSCFVDGAELTMELKKLYLPLCPVPTCWDEVGIQIPFSNIDDLKYHMKNKHHMQYCPVCLANRPLFLSEQSLYTQEGLKHHNLGACAYDSAAFSGHPFCHFCSSRKLFMDAEKLLQHMREDHFSCDLCNRDRFTFTFFKTRDKLLEHFLNHHKICEHPNCAGQDIMLRVFRDEFDLDVHRQREHHAKPATFRPGGFEAPHEGSRGRAADRGSSSSPGVANGMDDNVVRITFDYVGSEKTVELVQRRGGGRRKPNLDGGDAAEAFVPDSSGLPNHFLVKESVVRPMRREATEEEAREFEEQVSAVTIQKAGWGPSAEGKLCDLVNVDGEVQPRRKKKEKQKNEMGAKKESPNTRQAAEQRLDALLRRELPNPRSYDRLRNETRHFMNSVIKTSEYFATLVSLFTQEALEEIIPALIATCPQEEKGIALREMHRMRFAPEVIRAAKAQEAEGRGSAKPQPKRSSPAGSKETPEKKNAKSSEDSDWMLAMRQAEAAMRVTPPTNGLGKKGPPGAVLSKRQQKKQQKQAQGLNVWQQQSAALLSNIRESPNTSDAPAFRSAAKVEGAGGAPTMRDRLVIALAKEQKNTGKETSAQVNTPTYEPSSVTPTREASTRRTQHIDVQSEELFPSLLPGPEQSERDRLNARIAMRKGKGKPKYNAWFS